MRSLWRVLDVLDEQTDSAKDPRLDLRRQRPPHQYDPDPTLRE
jgi:hypothetical protein